MSHAAELERLRLRPRELALDGGFVPDGVAENLPGPDRVFVSGRQSAGSRRTTRRLVAQLEALGHTVTLREAQVAA